MSDGMTHSGDAPGPGADGGVPCCSPAMRQPARVLAWSEARVDAAATRGPVMALWLPEGVVVALGIGQNAIREADAEAMERDGVGLVRRQSGGGAVLLYPGVLCWEAWASTESIARADPNGDAGIRRSYEVLCRPVIQALSELGIAAFHAGICDISTMPGEGLPARKLAGTAQLRRRNMVLVHGSLLVDPDLDLLGRYLKFPSEQPDYRANRPHADFCATVASRVGGGGGLVRRVAGAVVSAAQSLGWETVTPPHDLDDSAQALLAAKYDNADWNWRKIRI